MTPAAAPPLPSPAPVSAPDLRALLDELWAVAWAEGCEYGTQGRVRSSEREEAIGEVLRAVAPAPGACLALREAHPFSHADDANRLASQRHGGQCLVREPDCLGLPDVIAAARCKETTSPDDGPVRLVVAEATVRVEGR